MIKWLFKQEMKKTIKNEVSSDIDGSGTFEESNTCVMAERGKREDFDKIEPSMT